MATTIPGGAYQRGDTWVDANGNELNKSQIAAAEKLQADRAADLSAAQDAFMQQQALRNPVAQALFAQQAIARTPAKSGKSEG